MALVDGIPPKRPLDGLDAYEIPQPKRFKVSDLPLEPEQRTAIDGLVHTIKKKGIYDQLRRKILEQFKESQEKEAFKESLHNFAQAEIDRDPRKWLVMKQNKAASLLQGVMDRSDIYQDAEASLEALIAQHIGQIEESAREIRQKDVGAEVAAQERKKGEKSEEEYASEAAQRREKLRKDREEFERKKDKADQLKALKLQEAQKIKELEQLRKKEERRLEREARKAAYLKGPAERKARYDQVKQEKERERAEEQDRMASQDSKSAPGAVVAKLTDEELEDLALNELIAEGAEMAAKSYNKPPDHIDEPAPPSRAASIAIPKGPSAERVKPTRKPDHPGPKLSYSSTVHRTAPQLPSGVSTASRDRSRSPYRHQNGNGERTPSISTFEQGQDVYAQLRSGSSSKFDNDYRASRRDSYDDTQSLSSHRRDSVRDPSRSGHHRIYDNDYEHDRDRERTLKEYDDRKARPSEHSTRKVDIDPHTGKARASLEDPPDNIDRYVPSKGSVGRPRERDRERDHDRDRNRHRDRERDRGDRRSSYDHRDRDRDRDRERHRDRDYSEKDVYGERRRGSERRDYERENHREKDDYQRTSHRDRDREREKDYARPFKSKRDANPKDIDRYVPGT